MGRKKAFAKSVVPRFSVTKNSVIGRPYRQDQNFGAIERAIEGEVVMICYATSEVYETTASRADGMRRLSINMLLALMSDDNQ